MAETAAAKLRTLQDNVPSIHRVEVGLDFRGAANSYDLIQICEFKTREDFDAFCVDSYMVGPDQKLVINPQTAPIVVEIFQRYANGENIRDIIKSLNKRGIKTTRGSEFRQSSLDTMLTNTKYLGVYRSMGEVIEGGVPQIIDQELFDKVAARKQRNRKAPSSTKAPETYLLTTKLFCGKCGAMMAGESGKSHTGAKYLYYKCGNRKRAQGCKQRALRKEYVEKIVLDRIIQLVHQDSVIDEISESAARIQSQESTAIPLLRGQLRDVNKGIDNMLNAIQMGIITNSTKERLDELEAEKKKLELAIAEETLEHPDVPKEYFEHWLRHFRSGDVDDPEYRKLLVDIFVNAIYVTDDGLRFALNFFDGVEIIPLREWDQAKGSDLLGYAPPIGHCTNTYYFKGGFAIMVWL